MHIDICPGKMHTVYVHIWRILQGGAIGAQAVVSELTQAAAALGASESAVALISAHPSL